VHGWRVQRGAEASTADLLLAYTDWGVGMGSDEQAKKAREEAEKAKLAYEVKLERERRARDLAREAARDAAKLDDKFK
jgi:hypothetical protein